MIHKQQMLELINHLQAITFDFSLTKDFEMVKDKHQKQIYAITNMAIELREMLHQRNINEAVVNEAFDFFLDVYSQLYDKSDRLRKSIFCKVKEKNKLAREERLNKNYKINK